MPIDVVCNQILPGSVTYNWEFLWTVLLLVTVLPGNGVRAGYPTRSREANVYKGGTYITSHNFQ
eukprot:1682051-Rhodomonas_salina.1